MIVELNERQNTQSAFRNAIALRSLSSQTFTMSELRAHCRD
jgi:hypothetical protein